MNTGEEKNSISHSNFIAAKYGNGQAGCCGCRQTITQANTRNILMVFTVSVLVRGILFAFGFSLVIATAACVPLLRSTPFCWATTSSTRSSLSLAFTKISDLEPGVWQQRLRELAVEIPLPKTEPGRCLPNKHGSKNFGIHSRANQTKSPVFRGPRTHKTRRYKSYTI